MEKVLELIKVDKRFGQYAALTNITWSLKQGECAAIVGGNGAGKSTLLHILAGLIRPSGGSRIAHIDPLRIGYVPERFPATRFRPTEYLRHVAAIQGLAKSEAARRIDAMMAVFQLPDTSMMRSSKGMLQKVNLMQALLRQPDLLLLDEPLSGLDEASQAEMVGILNETKRLGTAIVMSVHEPLLISSVADRVTRLSRGRIVHEGPPEIRISREEDEMRLEFANVAAHLLSELEEASGFLRWETKGKTGAVIVRASIADDVMLHILQSGGSILGVQRLHERSGAAGVPAQSARKGALA
ncbi:MULTISPECIES: ATP-binding cassette domain-containing protein [Paenibacillus]|uniref:ABC transporter n=1 Tax=Paenibacillus campinasensis TaxID=66347 RepID=A0A268ERY0_9BACL|nr:ATP-binding cassette domain-containing protein [Paenibacillus campinasensis]PAD75892.1 ABC transporter [Paenibacillus campinasensis]